MKLSLASLAFTASMVLSTAAFADADDTKWINKCVLDNVKEGQTTETVQKYCECMNSKMSDSETQSISEWEKTHKAEEEECSKASGWKK
ncbi:MAG: hypothetical protein J0L97_10850 [Alphaproteobacteria bacterium]|nr:hypothetical protein [Alphaproteobacteria bacterium]